MEWTRLSEYPISASVSASAPPCALRVSMSRSSSTAAGNITALATPKQRGPIADLAVQVAWRETDGFWRWLKRNMGLDRIRTSAEAARVNEGLKGLKRWGA